MTDSSIASSLTDLLPSSWHGHIHFTTRNRKLAVRLAPLDMIHLHKLDEKAEVVPLETSLIQSDLVQERDAAAYLVSQLTFLPLAITQSAAHMNENEI